MNENDVKQDGQEPSRTAVAAGAIIAGALDVADMFLEMMASRRTAEPTPNGESADVANEVRAPDFVIRSEETSSPDANDDDDDEIPVMSVKTKPKEQAATEVSFDVAEEDNTVEVRVSSQTPRTERAASATRLRGEALRELAEGVLDTFVEQVGAYMASSAAVNKVIRVQVDQLLRELEHDPQFTALLRAQVGEYIDELAADTAKLQPLTRSQIDTYFVHLTERPAVVEPLLRQQANLYLDKLLQDSAQANALAEKIADNYLARLQENPDDVEPLVRALAARYITTLQANPEELMPLIERLGDEYIDYLRANPQVVHDLVEGQSRNVMEEVVNEARERAATSDAVFELFARRLIGRPPREELPPPPPEVQQYAEPTPRTKKSQGQK